MKSCSKIFILVFTVLVLISAYPINFLAYAQSPGLENPEDVVDNTQGAVAATHSVSFTIPLNSLQVNPSDYIRITLPRYSDITLPTEIWGTYTGTPSYQLSDRTVLITGITITPGSRVTIEGITAVNPRDVFDYYAFIQIAEDINGTIQKNIAMIPVVQRDYRVDLSAVVGSPTAEILISGLGSPYGYLIFNDSSITLGTGVIGVTGIYSKLFQGIPPNTHSMSFYANDQEGRSTSAVVVDIATTEYQRTTLENQLLSPTIQIDDTSILSGEDIYATGSAAPSTTITVFTDSPLRSYQTTASASGNWTYSVSDTEDYSSGDYRMYALAQTGGGIQSIFSPAISFSVNSSGGGGGGGSACGDISEGDLNCDTSINLIDFSILMYYWGTSDETADINLDTSVGLIDFSIMMYNWGS